MQAKLPLWRKLSTGALGLLIAGSMLPESLLPHAGAVSGTTPVRVALSIKSSNYDNSFNYVSLTGNNGGLSIGFIGTSGVQSVYTLTGSQPIRGSLDSFYIVAGEYATWNEAVAAGQKLGGSGLTENIFIENRNGQKVYQVVQGYYATLADAQAKESVVKSLGFQTKLAGSLRLTAGSYASYQAAQQRADSIRSAQGTDAYVTARQNSAGSNTYEVWVGNETSSAARDSLKSQLQAKGISTSNADTSSNYVLFKQDGISDVSTTIPHIFTGAAGQELAVQGTGSPSVVKFLEKGTEGLSYRGQIILRAYNNRLAVVNSLPLDDYLKGVVAHEMSTGWPLEALKAQAVAARNYAVIQPSDKWGIAQVVDSTSDQAYGGYSYEYADTSRAVDETRGQVLMYNNGTPNNLADDYVISALYSSTHGGRSADGSEVWGNVSPYMKSVDSHWDSISINVQNELDWYRAVLPSGLIGFIRSDYVTKAGTQNKLGLQEAVIKADVNVRPAPDSDNSRARILGMGHQGERVVILETRKDFNVSAWSREYTAADMQNLLGVSTPLTSLLVSKTGPSGRVQELTANGQPIAAPGGKGDNWRSKLGVLGTLFTVEQTGNYTVMGANGKTSQYPDAKGQGLQVISANKAVSQVNGGNDSFVVMNNNSQFRVAAKEPGYILNGSGWGHGLGMSQWGAYGMAVDGFKYDEILTHYYTNVYLTPKQ